MIKISHFQLDLKLPISNNKEQPALGDPKWPKTQTLLKTIVRLLSHPGSNSSRRRLTGSGWLIRMIRLSSHLETSNQRTTKGQLSLPSKKMTTRMVSCSRLGCRKLVAGDPLARRLSQARSTKAAVTWMMKMIKSHSHHGLKSQVEGILTGALRLLYAKTTPPPSQTTPSTTSTLKSSSAKLTTQKQHHRRHRIKSSRRWQTCRASSEATICKRWWAITSRVASITMPVDRVRIRHLEEVMQGRPQLVGESLVILSLHLLKTSSLKSPTSRQTWCNLTSSVTNLKMSWTRCQSMPKKLLKSGAESTSNKRLHYCQETSLP